MIKNLFCTVVIGGGLLILSTDSIAQESKKLYQIGLASLYDFKGDKFSGQHVYACESRLKMSLGAGRWSTMLESGIAHRRLPCGTKVCIRLVRSIKLNSLECMIGYVIDRGPYGALNKKNEWYVRGKLQPGERYRGIVDLRPPIAQKLLFNGLEKIELYIFKENI